MPVLKIKQNGVWTDINGGQYDNSYIATDENNDGNVVIEQLNYDADGASIQEHANDKNNPHNVTAEQVGAASEDHSHSYLEVKEQQIVLPEVYAWNDIAYGNGLFVAVSSYADGMAAYSTDGINWKTTTVTGVTNIGSITFGGDKFVAISNDGTNAAAYSFDGIDWNSTTMPSAAMWQSVTYGGDKFVAVSQDGYAAYSTNGITWLTSNMIGSNMWYSIAYGNGRFVAVTGDDSRVVACSTDGISWSNYSTTTPYATDIIYATGNFVAISSNTNPCTTMYSSDGGENDAWTTVTIPDLDSALSAIANNGRCFVAVGLRGKYVYSLDGASWTVMNMPINVNWYCITYGNGVFVAISEMGHIAYSSDGYDWTNSAVQLLQDGEGVSIPDVEKHVGNMNNPHSVTIEQIGAAPAGYGLGESTQKYFPTSEDDLNGILDTIISTMPDGAVGFYRVLDNTSAVWGGGSLTASVFKTNDNYSTVEFYGYLVDGMRFSKTKTLGNWSALEWVNPPMEVGVEYRTTERFDGKPVWTALVSPGVLASGMASVPHNITMTTLISCMAFVEGEHNLPAKYKDNTYDQEVTAYATYINIFIYSNGMIDSIGKKVYCILKYLKD